MIENTATYDFLIENENHSRIAPKKTRFASAGSDVEGALDQLDARERKGICPTEGDAGSDFEEDLDPLDARVRKGR